MLPRSLPGALTSRVMSDELLESSSDVDVAVLLGALPLAAAISSSSEPEGGLKSESGEIVV